MVACWALFLVLRGEQSGFYPDEVMGMLKSSGFSISNSYTPESGQLSTGDLSIPFMVESNRGKAVALLFASHYSFPKRLSARGLQDWTSQTRYNLKAQAYLDGSVYISERVELPSDLSSNALSVTIRNALAPFALFNTNYLRPLSGQQVFDHVSVTPPRPSDKLVVDYLSPIDFNYLAKIWGWSYHGPFATGNPYSWAVPVSIDGRMWRITGLGQAEPGQSPISGFSVVGQFQAPSPKTQKMAAKWHNRFRGDQVILSPDSANVTVQTKISFGEGMPLATVRQKILDFVHRAEKLPEADMAVFG